MNGRVAAGTPLSSNPALPPRILKSPMRTLARTVFAVVLVCAIGVAGRPWIERACFVATLATEEPPAALATPLRTRRAPKFVNSWGNPRPDGRRHEGIDIFAPADTPVLSTTRGIVTRVGTNRLGGQVVWVLGPGLERHYYAHLSRYGDVREGDRVEAGDVIGYTGNTGNARGGPAHLHYGIYGHAGARNPYSRLVAGSEPARVATRTNPPRHRFSAP
jgi:peptidoglycan LD-endopeptidase LytH